MSLNRYAKKKDSTQDAIVNAIRNAGWRVWVLSKPVDLLCWKLGKGFRLVEVKSSRKKDGTTAQDKRQQDQIDFIALTDCPVVTTPEEALIALGEIRK